MPYFPKKPATVAPLFAHKPSRARSRFADIDELAAKTFARAIRQQAHDGHAKARVLLLGFHGDDLTDLRGQLRQIGVKTTAAISNPYRLPEFSAMQQAFSHILINLDAFEDVDEGIDALLAFRAVARGFVVILCSAKVSADDFGTERAPICEATFRLPISLAALQQGLSIGIMHPDMTTT
jgi:hypothetical protein